MYEPHTMFFKHADKWRAEEPREQLGNILFFTWMSFRTQRISTLPQQESDCRVCVKSEHPFITSRDVEHTALLLTSRKTQRAASSTSTNTHKRSEKHIYILCWVIVLITVQTNSCIPKCCFKPAIWNTKEEYLKRSSSLFNHQIVSPPIYTTFSITRTDFIC